MKRMFPLGGADWEVCGARVGQAVSVPRPDFARARATLEKPNELAGFRPFPLSVRAIEKYLARRPIAIASTQPLPWLI